MFPRIKKLMLTVSCPLCTSVKKLRRATDLTTRAAGSGPRAETSTSTAVSSWLGVAIGSAGGSIVARLFLVMLMLLLLLSLLLVLMRIIVDVIAGSERLCSWAWRGRSWLSLTGRFTILCRDLEDTA